MTSKKRRKATYSAAIGSPPIFAADKCGHRHKTRTAARRCGEKLHRVANWEGWDVINNITGLRNGL